MICGSHCPAWQSCPMGGGADTPAEPFGGEPNEIDGGMTIIRHPDGSTEQRYNGITIHNPPPGTYDENGDPVEPIGPIGPIGAEPGLAKKSLDLRGTGGSPVRPTASPDAETHRRAADATKASAKTPELSYAQALLKLPLSERPLCPYEQAEYNATVTDLMPRTAGHRANAFGLHLAHQIALLTVMVSRAARALAVAPLTETMEQTAEHYRMALEKPSAALVAFEKLSRELRRWITLLEQHHAPSTVVPDKTAREHAHRQQHDTNPDPDAQAALNTASAANTPATATHASPALDQLDRQIVNALLGRLNPKPQDTAHTETAEKIKEPRTGFT